MKDITFHGQTFILDPSGILIWPSQKIAIVADLHLEKASYFARFGQMLPPHDSFETLKKLEHSLLFSGCSRLILLGDSFHDEGGFSRLDQNSRNLFEKLCKSYEVIWVIGNHDGDFVPDNTRAVDEIEIAGLMFRHEAVHGAVSEISGHYHPKAELNLRGSRVSRPCFIHDNYRMILPAFGTLTGGLNIQDEVISSLFAQNYMAHLLGEKRIYSVPAHKF
ncbi:MAG: ligase-associated DNA damage response endonuclease PdeM [Bdellovibrionales bacterium]